MAVLHQVALAVSTPAGVEIRIAHVAGIVAVGAVVRVKHEFMLLPRLLFQLFYGHSLTNFRALLLPCKDPKSVECI